MKVSDCVFLINSAYDTFVFDVPRGCSITEEFYTLFENILDGVVLSGKFVPKIVSLPEPRLVLVLANTTPVLTLLSEDRWNVIEI